MRKPGHHLPPERPWVPDKGACSQSSCAWNSLLCCYLSDACGFGQAAGAVSAQKSSDTFHSARWLGSLALWECQATVQGARRSSPGCCPCQRQDRQPGHSAPTLTGILLGSYGDSFSPTRPKSKSHLGPACLQHLSSTNSSNPGLRALGSKHLAGTALDP